MLVWSYSYQNNNSSTSYIKTIKDLKEKTNKQKNCYKNNSMHLFAVAKNLRIVIFTCACFFFKYFLTDEPVISVNISICKYRQYIFNFSVIG